MSSCPTSWPSCSTATFLRSRRTGLAERPSPQAFRSCPCRPRCSASMAPRLAATVGIRPMMVGGSLLLALGCAIAGASLPDAGGAGSFVALMLGPLRRRRRHSAPVRFGSEDSPCGARALSGLSRQQRHIVVRRETLYSSGPRDPPSLPSPTRGEGEYLQF